MNIFDILRSLTPKHFVDYGVVIANNDIVNACKLYGQDNADIIKSLLLNLEKQNKLSIVYMNKSGFEDLIVGVKLR
ncbi:hypothetical protein GCM10007425_12460 [Lysinibacillus alkalisoli]|uniref:Uncharacterized protein n=1 Tax=Lysinibacillus alkalisoli TaxID=1911548 RepID=A0A917G2K5_9BACI|nr:hypothetical protein [Lysinibacillus alkalisoli]GGG19506.1 hypothetical protein GCM10007425_12460 [Lysinibacillus alkalisoli]